MMKSLYAAFTVGACMAAVICNLAAQTASSPDGPFLMVRHLQDGHTLLVYGSGKSQNEVLAGIVDKSPADGPQRMYMGKAKYGKVLVDYAFNVVRDGQRYHVTPRIKSVVTGKPIVDEKEIVLDRL